MRDLSGFRSLASAGEQRAEFTPGRATTIRELLLAPSEEQAGAPTKVSVPLLRQVGRNRNPDHVRKSEEAAG
jgi:hypothetical protein